MKKLIMLLGMLAFLIVSKSLIYGQVVNYADSVIDFSSEYGAAGWGSIQALGPPNVFPDFMDSRDAWSPATENDQREFIELYYNNNTAIDFIQTYETWGCCGIDTIYVRNPATNQWQIVYSGSILDSQSYAREKRVSFPLTSFIVTDVRIAINSPATWGFQEIDAVGIGNSNIISDISANVLAANVKLYPNPAKDNVSIELGAYYDRVSLSVTDIMGKTVYANDFLSAASVNFHLKGRPGLYFVTLRSADQQVTLKLLKE